MTMFLELNSEVGIQRDGTDFDSSRYTNGSWTRFYKGRPQKIGGYQTINNGTTEIVRNLFSINSLNSVILYVGRPSNLEFFTLSTDLTATLPTDVTPVGFVPDPSIVWSFATIGYKVGDVETDYILALPIKNGNDISNQTAGTLYYGVVGSSDKLIPVIDVDGNPIQATGGVVVVGNFVMVYGNIIQWNDGSSLNAWPTANVAVFETSKFVFGAPVRSGPTLSALFWSLDFLAQLSLNNDTPPTFISSYVSTQSTLLSANSIVSDDPYFYWVGNNSFYYFNGSVIELNNTTNKQWFFDNVNREAKEKVYGVVNRIYKEIWFLAPFGSATENTNACIYSVGNEAWFDTDQIPRSCALASTTQFPYPIMCSSQPILNGSSLIYPIWVHEFGLDKVQLGQTIAINAHFESNQYNLWQQSPENIVMGIDEIIPDIEQTGNMFVQFKTKGYPNSPAQLSEFFTLEPDREFLTVRQKGSIFSAVFISNVVGGNFLMGKTLFKLVTATDQRPGPSLL